MGIGIGVGVGAFAIIAFGAWFCLRRRRRSQRQGSATPLPPPAEPEKTNSYIPPAPVSQTNSPVAAAAIARKPVKAQEQVAVSPISSTTELEGGQGVRREISGREIHPFPVINQNQPPVVVPGEYELHGHGTPPPNYQYQQAGRGGAYQHSELP